MRQRILGQCDDFRLRDPANGHGVEPDLVEAGLHGRVDPGQHAGQPFPAGDAAEGGLLQRVQADVQPTQPGGAEGGGVFRQQQAVGRHGQIGHTRDGRQLADQRRESRAHQRLAPRDPQPAHALRDHDPHKPLDLLEMEDLAARPELHRLLRHAVEAAQIAAIGHAHAQIVVNPTEAVDQRPFTLHPPLPGSHYGHVAPRAIVTVGSCLAVRRPDSPTRWSRPRSFLSSRWARPV